MTIKIKFPASRPMISRRFPFGSEVRVLASEKPQGAPKGVVPLSAAIGALREELTRAWLESRNRSVRFKPSPVELTLQAAVTSAGKGGAGVHWWLIELGGEVSRQSVVTQTIKVTLEPTMLDESGQPLEFLVDATDESGTPPRAGSAEAPLDAVG